MLWVKLNWKKGKIYPWPSRLTNSFRSLFLKISTLSSSMASGVVHYIMKRDNNNNRHEFSGLQMKNGKWNNLITFVSSSLNVSEGPSASIAGVPFASSALLLSLFSSNYPKWETDVNDSAAARIRLDSIDLRVLKPFLWNTFVSRQCVASPHVSHRKLVPLRIHRWDIAMFSPKYELVCNRQWIHWNALEWLLNFILSASFFCFSNLYNRFTCKRSTTRVQREWKRERRDTAN